MTRVLVARSRSRNILYLFISIAYELRLCSKMNRCVSLGLKIDNALKRKVKSFNDPQIPVEKVNQT